MKKLTTDDFILKSNEIHNNKYDYSKAEYENSRTKVKIICPEHGVFEKTPNIHLKGQGCPKCSQPTHCKNTTDFINKANEIHDFKYDYSNVVYRGSKNTVSIICPIHGEFEQIPNVHYRSGCNKCGYDESAKKQIEKAKDVFEYKSNIIHNNKYDYSLVDYLSATDKIIINCPIHGEFEQKPAAHLSGQGCPSCGKIKQNYRQINYYTNNIEGKNQGILYFLKFKHILDDETFYKVGITKHDIKIRFCNKQYKDYTIEVVKLYKDTNLNCAIIENEIHKKYSGLKYIPKNKFGGYTECYGEGLKILLADDELSSLINTSNIDINVPIKIDSIVGEYNPYIEDLKPTFPFEAYDLEGEQLEDFKSYISENFNTKLEPWSFYVTKKDIFCFNPNLNKLECISKNKDYCKLNLDNDIVFKPKDKYQKAAVYSILNCDATLLIGGWGTGKSIVSVATALSLSKDKKVFILRPTISSKRYDVGFMPGDKNEKLYQYFSGFMSALASLYGNTRTTKNKEGISYDYIKEDLSQEKFEFLSMPELHGLSIQEGDIIVVDEAQLIDINYMSLLISRIGEGAKLVLMGDLNQTTNLLKMSESGLSKLLSVLPNKTLSVVELKEVYRNKELCELADNLMK